MRWPSVRMSRYAMGMSEWFPVSRKVLRSWVAMTTLVVVCSTFLSAISFASALPLLPSLPDHSLSFSATVAETPCHPGEHHASAASDRASPTGLNLDGGCVSMCCHIAWAIGASPLTLAHRFARGTVPAILEPLPLGRTVAPDTPPPIA